MKRTPSEFYKLLAAWIRETGGVAKFDHFQDLTNPSSNDPNKVAIVKKLSAYCKQDNNISNLHKKDYELLEQYEKFTN